MRNKTIIMPSIYTYMPKTTIPLKFFNNSYIMWEATSVQNQFPCH